MPAPRISYARLIFWLLFYAGLLPYALPRCLDWLSRSSNWWLGCGALGLIGLAAGVGLSLYQAGRWLTRYFSSK
jgi:hypothetical protein